MNDASAMNTALDHIVFATSNLALATEAFADLTGCLPIPGGPHPVMGTRNALVSFGDGVYLEIIGPDPERKVDGLQAAAMAASSSSDNGRGSAGVDALRLMSSYASTCFLTISFLVWAVPHL